MNEDQIRESRFARLGGRNVGVLILGRQSSREGSDQLSALAREEAIGFVEVAKTQCFIIDDRQWDRLAGNVPDNRGNRGLAIVVQDRVDHQRRPDRARDWRFRPVAAAKRGAGNGGPNCGSLQPCPAIGGCRSM